MVVLLFFSSALQYLPHCVLAGIVFTIGITLIDIKSLSAIRQESPGEFTLALVTAAAVVMIAWRTGSCLPSRCRCCGMCAIATTPTP